MEHAKTCQRPISLERRLAATYLVAGLVTAGLAGCAAGLIFSVPPHPMWLATLQHR
jgi:branched-subunit amino acid ABC-type transport system permease component